MAHFSRQEVLNVLQKDWGEYVQSFQRLSPEEQSAFLARQGYARFADLLAHIVAWWQAGFETVEQYLKDPAFQPIQYNVDDFNARAVAAVAGLDEEQVFESFERTRNFLIEFVKGLPEAAFANERVTHQLDMELAGHLSEHQINPN